MPNISARLEQLGLTLPEPAAPIASYVPAVSVASGDHRLVFVSGQLPLEGGILAAVGPVPDPVSIEQARACARMCVLNALAAAAAEIGDIERIRRAIKLEGFVAAGPGFADHPKVVNGASDLLVELLGDEGRHARAAVGVPSLPMQAPVEIAAVFEVD